MELPGLIATTRRQFGGHGLALGSSALLFVGVVFFPSFPPMGLCCSLVLPIEGTGLGNVFGGAVCLRGNTFKSCFLHYSCPPLFSPYPPFSLSPSPSFSLSPFLSLSHLLSLSPLLSLSLSLSPLLSLSCGFLP